MIARKITGPKNENFSPIKSKLLQPVKNFVFALVLVLSFFSCYNYVKAKADRLIYLVNMLELLSDLLNKSLLDLVSSFAAINEPPLHLIKAKWKPWEAKGHNKTDISGTLGIRASGL